MKEALVKLAEQIVAIETKDHGLDGWGWEAVYAPDLNQAKATARKVLEEMSEGGVKRLPVRDNQGN